MCFGIRCLASLTYFLSFFSNEIQAFQLPHYFLASPFSLSLHSISLFINFFPFFTVSPFYPPA